MEAYLQHKAGEQGPFQTEAVAVRESKAPRSGQTQSGYGSKLPTPYEVRRNGRWQRVYAICYSNAATHYIRATDAPGGRIIVRIDR